MTAGGVVTNGQSGSITGLIRGGTTGVEIAGGSGNVTNFGTIETLDSGSYSSIAVFLQAGGSVENFGTIAGSIGVNFSGTDPGTVTNAGTISGDGGTAVRFGGGDDRLIVDPGAVFVGTVDGGGGSDMLELAAGTGNKTLSGLGTSFVDFETAVFDANADWRVTLDNPAAFTGTISGFCKGDILDLTGKAATGVTYAGGVLTVRDGGTVVATLNLTGSYTSADFSVSSDGQGGTDIGIAAARPVNTPPVVTPTSANLTATTGQSFAASSLFTASDADGDAITRYDFWDTGAAAGTSSSTASLS